MYISCSIHLKESFLKLRYVYIIECLSQEKLFKVAVCIYHQVFISRKGVLKLRYGYIMIKFSSLGKLFKVAVWIYHKQCSLKLRYEYIIKCSSQGKLFKVAV